MTRHLLTAADLTSFRSAVESAQRGRVSDAYARTLEGPGRAEVQIRVGINSPHPDSRASQMPAFGRDQILQPPDVDKVVAFVRSLSNPSTAKTAKPGDVDAGLGAAGAALSTRRHCLAS